MVFGQRLVFSDERKTTGWGKLKVNKFIVADRSGVHISCLRHGFKKDNLVCHTVHLKHGDLVTLKNRKKYIVDAGWFILAQINGCHEEFMCADELEKAAQSERILDETDCFLKLCSVSYYLDQALAARNKEEFIRLSAERNAWAGRCAQLSGEIFVGS